MKTKQWVVAGVIGILGACGSDSMGSWTTHRDPAGFSIELPSGWQATSNEGQVDASGPDGAEITVLPFHLQSQALDPARAAGLLRLLVEERWPGRGWLPPSGGASFGSDGVRLVAAIANESGESPSETAALWWGNSPAGVAAMLYRVLLPSPSDAELQSTVARVIGSFRFSGSDPSAGGDQTKGPVQPVAPRYVRWVDPTEGAYSVEIPEGWNARGGIQRRSDGTKSETVFLSPDGNIWMRSGDVGIPINYMAPNPTLMSLGNVEGQGGILRVMTGADYAGYYVQQTVGAQCQRLQFLEQRDRSDHVQALAAKGLLMPKSQNSAGEVSFSCVLNGQPRVGFFYAATSATNYQGTAVMWNVQRLFGFLAPPDRAAEARNALQHVLTTSRVDPRWLAGELQHNQGMVDSQRSYLEYSAQLSQSTFAERWDSQTRIAEGRGDVLSGVTRMVDPQSGLSYQVQTGANYHWIDPVREVVAGTDLAYRPTWDFRELVESPR